MSTPTQPQLHMRRELVGLPDLSIPSGYALRPLQPRDVDRWADLLARNAELGTWDYERAAPYFAPGAPMILDGSFFVTLEEQPVATAQLHVHRDDSYAPIPELGWVAVVPEQQGRGLGYIVCLAVLQHAQSQRFSRIFLRTDDHRLPAIKTYLKLGFQPWIRDPETQERWVHVLDRLNLK